MKGARKGERERYRVCVCACVWVCVSEGVRVDGRERRMWNCDKIMRLI